MVKITLAFLVILSCFFYGCNLEPATIKFENNSAVERLHPYSTDNLVPRDSLAHTIADITCFRIATKDTIIISGDNQLIEAGNNYVLTDKQLRFALLLDSNGKVLKPLGDFGAKPGQYLSVETVIYDKKSENILLYTSEKQSVLTFDREGIYKGEFKTDFFGSDFKLLDNDRLAFFTNQNRSKASDSYNVLITNRNGKLLSRGYNWKPLPDVSYAFAGGFSKSESTLFNKPFSDSLFQVSPNEIKIKYIVSFDELTLPDKFKPKLKNYMPEAAWNYSSLKLPLIDTKNYLSIVYSTKKRMEGCVFSKNSRKKINYPSVKNVFPINELIKTCSGSYETDYFYSLLNLSGVLNHLKKNPEDWENLKACDQHLYEIIKNSRIDDNPIVVKFKYSF